MVAKRRGSRVDRPSEKALFQAARMERPSRGIQRKRVLCGDSGNRSRTASMGEETEHTQERRGAQSRICFGAEAASSGRRSVWPRKTPRSPSPSPPLRYCGFAAAWFAAPSAGLRLRPGSRILFVEAPSSTLPLPTAFDFRHRRARILPIGFQEPGGRGRMDLETPREPRAWTSDWHQPA